MQETHAADAATHMNSKDVLIQTLEALLLHETSQEYQGLITKFMDTDYSAVPLMVKNCKFYLQTGNDITT